MKWLCFLCEKIPFRQIHLRTMQFRCVIVRRAACQWIRGRVRLVSGHTTSTRLPSSMKRFLSNRSLNFPLRWHRSIFSFTFDTIFMRNNQIQFDQTQFYYGNTFATSPRYQESRECWGGGLGQLNIRIPKHNCSHFWLIIYRRPEVYFYPVRRLKFTTSGSRCM